MSFDVAYVHAQTRDDVLDLLATNEETGLSTQQAEDRRKEYGYNELPEGEGKSFFALIIEQFEDLLVRILLAAAVISFLLALTEEGEDKIQAFFEPAVILIILILNAIVGVWQEKSAENSIAALKKSEAKDCAVLRDGHLQTLHARELVPGDVITINVGDKVPADCRLLNIKTAAMSVDEALLTGESVEAAKQEKPIRKRDGAVPQDKRNCIFAGTLVVRGQGTAVVTSIGQATALGQIHEALSEEDDKKTPLQEKLDEFGEDLSRYIMWICIAVWLININHFSDEEFGGWYRGAIYYFKIAVALAVAAIPEGLPAVVTTCLTLGTMRMAKKNAIVRSLPSVETLGCTTVICSDKTGTLTTNRMSVQHMVTVDTIKGNKCKFSSFSVKGDSYAPYAGPDTGNVYEEDGKSERELVIPAVEIPNLANVSRICALCNESSLQYDKTKASNASDAYGKTGSPTEAALLVLAEKLGIPDQQLCESNFKADDPLFRISAARKFWESGSERLHLLEFDRSRKSMSVLVKDKSSGERVLLCKGAPESVIDRCKFVTAADGSVSPLTPQMKAQLMQQNDNMASQGLRVLALSFLVNPKEKQDWTEIEHFRAIESNMTLVGLVGMLDPPRMEVAASIEKSHHAGIRVIVITGDNKVTAESICRRIGVFGEDEDTSESSFTGEEFEAMSAARKREAVARAKLYSRVEPKHKQTIVKLLQEAGEITAMTGDGVNDAPALKTADIGIAMGSGTDVAREASDMVLQDDNFATIVMAVEEGRAIYSNTKQFIRYLISSNIGEVACIFMTAAIGMPEALIPVQLLWVNLVTDGLPATALGFNPPDADIMDKPPRDRSEGIINGWMFFRYMAIGIYVGIATVGSFIYWYLYAEEGPHITLHQLRNFHSCPSWPTDWASFNGFDPAAPCAIFHDAVPSTVSLSVLVTIEMFNALNALSENQSLLVVPIWSNMWVVAAVILSFVLHFGIVYIPYFAKIFHVAPLNWVEWEIVLAWSFPVFLLDEVLKFITRHIQAQPAHKKTE